MSPDAVGEIFQRYKHANVSKTIAPPDEMWHSGQSWYFSVGESGVLAILRGLALGSLGHVETILDLPCGHGRVARHLRAAFPDASMTFCDLLRSGVDFCVQTFGGRGIYSIPDLTQVSLPGPFDVIWVGSLFTHLNLDLTVDWISFLCRQLSDDGILVATFHGRWSLELQQTYPLIDDSKWPRIVKDFERQGYGYADYGASPGRREKVMKMARSIPGLGTGGQRDRNHATHDASFGISVSKPEKIVEIASSIPEVRILAYTERGWGDNHDVLTLARTDRLKPWG
jgi:SAM-dependent methyltransferase